LPTCKCGCGAEVRRDYVNGHNRRFTPYDYLEEDRGHDTPCWIWQRAVNNRGYGLLRRGGRQFPAHRWYYIERFGEVPEGLELDHLCRQRTCVRPEHMEPVTPEVNRQRGKNAKLTPAMVRQIRASPLPSRALAPTLGVSHTAVDDVRSGRRWGNVR
jgi:hypothetical protein